MPDKPCIVKFKKERSDIHKYLEKKIGFEFNEGSYDDKGKSKLSTEQMDKIKEAIKEIQNENLSNLENIYSQLDEKKETPTDTKPPEEKITTNEGANTTIPPTDEGKGAGKEDGGDLSGIKKALVPDDIVKNTDFEKIGDEDMMAMGRKILDKGEVKPEALVTKIITEGKGVLTPSEVVALITYKRDIDNAIQDTYKKINEKRQAGDDIGTLGVEAVNLERQINDFDVMAVITAQQQSLAFRLRQKMLDRDYNVVTQIERYKKNNNGVIPPEIEAKFRDLDKQLQEAKAKISELEKKKDEEEGKQAADNIKESVDREKKYTEEELEKKVNEGVQSEINKIYEQLPADKKTLADKAITALENIQKKLRGKTYSDVTGFTAIVDAGITTIKNAIKLGVTVQRAVEIGINKIKEKLGNKKWDKEDEFRKDMIDGFETEGVSTKKVKDKPTINEDGTVSIPNQMIRDIVEKGVTDINDITDAVHDQVKKDLPDISKRQVRDYITDYGKKVNPTADDLQTQVNTAKRVGRLLSELEDLNNKKRKEKNQGNINKITDKERELKRQINSLIKDTFGKDEKSDEQKLFDAKERTKTRISELERKLKNKDFAKPKKKLTVTDSELTNLNAKKEKLQEEYENEQYKVELKNRTWWQKVEDVALELTNGLVRGLVASFDLSAGLVQGMYRLFADVGKSAIQLATLRQVTPNRSLNAFGTMFQAVVSQKFADDYLSKLKASKDYPLLKATKLAIDDKSGRVSAKEGVFISNWVNLIWDNFVSRILGVGTKQGTDFFRKLNPYSASQRAFDGYVNSIRVNSFIDLAKALEKDGHTYESDPKVFDKAADFVNTTTGRGSLGAADASSRWLNIFLFAPRKVISEVKLFTPYAFLYYAKMPKAVRKKALINLSTFLGTFMTANALLWAALRDEDDEEDNFWNMDSSDFLTHKIGDKRLGFGGGAKSMIVFQSRLIGDKFTDQYGNDTKFGERFGKTINTKLDLIWRFILGKASPAIGVAAQKLDERKGLEVENIDIIKDLSVPIWLQDIKELHKEDPVAVNTILSVFGFFGANVRTVDEQKNKSNKTFTIYNPSTLKKREATEAEVKKAAEDAVILLEQEIKKAKINQGWGLNKYGEMTIDDKEVKKKGDYNKLSEEEKKDLEKRLKRSTAEKAQSKIKF